MALIAVPSEAWEVSVGWRLAQPNQVTVRSQGSTQVLSRGRGRWQGEVDIGLMGSTQEAQEVTAWINALQGSANEFEIPMHQDAELAGSPTVTVASSRVVAGVLELTMPITTPGFLRGNMVRIGSRAYQLVSDQVVGSGSSTITVAPNVAPANGSRIVYADATMQVRLREEPPFSYATPYFVGPWTLFVEEA